MKTPLITLFILLVSLNLNAKIIYTDPVNNAKYVSIYNSIIIGFDDKITSTDLSTRITVKGSLSGIHSGEFVITEDSKKLIFKPNMPFVFGETVEVKMNNLKTSQTARNNITYSFFTQMNRPVVDYDKYIEDENSNSLSNNFVYSDNNLIPPPLTVTISNNPTPGLLYLNNAMTPTYPPHLIIANTDGTHFYTRQMTTNVPDFKKQPNGNYTYYFASGRKFYEEDVNFNKVDSFYTGNGYLSDSHELKLLPNRHALLMSYDPQTVDMSVIVAGGNPNCVVTGLIIQEIDENKNVVFQWRSWDHYNIVDATHTNLTLATVDYAHGNAIELDTDGNLMISARHLSEITKINRSTGAMIWRLGGVNNQFSFPNDSISISFQHDIRRIANGNVTLYDNGNFHTPAFSRAIEYQLDEVNKIATLVWQYRNTPDIYGGSRGSVQRLRNGNTLISWGGTNPTMSEVTYSGTVALEMSLPSAVYSYRTYKDELSISLNLNLAIEGFYNSTSNKMNMKDTVKAYLRNINSPYNIVDSAKSVIDSVTFLGIFKFYNSATGNYYFSVKHRNSLETWSKAGGESLVIGTSYNYNMTDLSSKAYGNNIVQVDAAPVRFALYSGDVNNDLFVDMTDVISIYNDASNFVTGYNLSDVTGNNISDLVDELIAYNNANNFVSVINP